MNRKERWRTLLWQICSNRLKLFRSNFAQLWYRRKQKRKHNQLCKKPKKHIYYDFLIKIRLPRNKTGWTVRQRHPITFFSRLTSFLEKNNERVLNLKPPTNLYEPSNVRTKLLLKRFIWKCQILFLIFFFQRKRFSERALHTSSL